MKGTTPPAHNKCGSGGECRIVGHVFLQLPVSVSSRNKQGYAWLALHEVAAKRGPRSGILQLTHSYRRRSEHCNHHFLPLPLLSTEGWARVSMVGTSEANLSSFKRSPTQTNHQAFQFVPGRGSTGSGRTGARKFLQWFRLESPLYKVCKEELSGGNGKSQGAASICKGTESRPASFTVSFVLSSRFSIASQNRSMLAVEASLLAAKNSLVERLPSRTEQPLEFRGSFLRGRQRLL